jgi:hypothetical protein
VMVKDLLSPLVLVGLILGGGAFGGSFLVRELGKEAGCPEAMPAESRDAEAQVLVDEAGQAIAAAHEIRDDVQLYRINKDHPGGTFYFLPPDEPPPAGPLLGVAFPRVGEPRVHEIRAAQIYKGFFKLQEPMIRTLDDLVLGWSRAISTLKAEYPSAITNMATLMRGEDCRLAWRVTAAVEVGNEEWLGLTALVDNETGRIEFPYGPPAPFESRSYPRTPLD